MQSVGPNLNETYDATAASVADARARLAGLAAAAGARPEQIDAVRLAVSEAMTNAILHAYDGGPGVIHVDAATASGELSILISDDGCGLSPRANRAGLGFGLGLISQVSDECAVVSRAEGGTEVRIRFDLNGGRAGARAARRRKRSRRPARRTRWSAALPPSMSAA